jgi:quinol monooxygenase YgiN
MQFHVDIRMLVPARKVKEALSTLRAMVERIKVKEGCLGCRLYQEVVDGKTLLFEVVWVDEESMQKHLRSAEFRYVLLVVEMAHTPPEFRFDRIADSLDLDTVEALRKWTDSLPGEKDQSVF